MESLLRAIFICVNGNLVNWLGKRVEDMYTEGRTKTNSVDSPQRLPPFERLRRLSDCGVAWRMGDRQCKRESAGIVCSHLLEEAKKRFTWEQLVVVSRPLSLCAHGFSHT